jgi:hypothetical protein
MISPNDIKKTALRWYDSFLSESIEGIEFFPREVRFGKIRPSEVLHDFIKFHKEIESLRNGSKETLGFGYIIEFEKIKNRNVGEQSFPTKIYFEAPEDYLKFIRKEREYSRFRDTTKAILSEFPILKEWLVKHPTKVIENFDKWFDLLKVCHYFVEHPKPGVYVREIPLDISTKFIEENESILKLLLDVLVENDANKDESTFEKRFNLKYREELIRVRILDEELALKYFNGFSDISIPQSLFLSQNIPCKKVFVLENHTNFSNILNFLTLPQLKESIAIFGKGFQIGLLKDTSWLSNCDIIYWGDIDCHGFQILSQIRGYFPGTRSCMMDFQTFNDFHQLEITGVDTTVTHLDHLTEEEHRLFTHLLDLKEKNRLEQEKIPHSYAMRKIEDLFEG